MDQTAYFEQMRQKRRSEILAKARQMILAEGPMTFTMQNLAKSLDISNVTLYKYFKNSEDLLRTLYQETAKQYSISQVLYPQDGSPLDTFLQNIRFSLDEYLESREDTALLVILSLCGRASGEALGDLFDESFCEKETLLLSRAREEGQVRSDLSAGDTFRFLNSLCSSYLYRVALMTEQEYRAQKKEILRQTKELILMIRSYLTAPACP